MFDINAVIAAVFLMLLLSLLRVNVVLALTVSAFTAGVLAGLPTAEVIATFNSGLGGGATIALGYAMLGAFAFALSHSGITDFLSQFIIKKLSVERSVKNELVIRYGLYFFILSMAIASQNLIPIHIAFIPILIPPLLHTFSKLKVDRRLIVSLITYGLVTTYMILPIGFGGIFLNDILLANLVKSGLSDATASMIPTAMALPALGMTVGLVVAVFISYKKPREYDESKILEVEPEVKKISLYPLLVGGVAIIATLVIQLKTDSMVFGALTGFMILSVSGILKCEGSNAVFQRGALSMASIGFIMIAAFGFSAVIRATGHVPLLVDSITGLVGYNKAVVALLMLVIGLIITMGIGSSFSTIPIITSIYVPLAQECGFSVMATIALVGTAAALGDAGSPASDSTLGPTAGLNIDGQHDHIWDSVVPTFLHYNIPLVIFGWIAAMVL